MTLQSSGTITMAQINSEFSRGNNLNSYRGTTWWKDDASTGTFSSGAINFSDFYSTRVSAPGYPGNDSYTKLLLHFDGNFTDSSSSGKSPATQYGSPSCSATQSKFGGQSLYLSGSQSLRYADHADFEPDADWTVDFWFYYTGAANAVRCLVGKMDELELAWGATGSGKVTLYVYDNSGISYGITKASLSTSTWYHLAIVRSGTTYTMYFNGTSAGSVNPGSAPPNTTYTFTIGGLSNATTQLYIGYIDEFRVSKGIARWTSNFTPPTLQYV